MSSCCDPSPRSPVLPYATPGTPASDPPATLTVALAGNPNCGKTTLFNALTGLRQKVANYPGVTVEKKTGRCKLPGGRWAAIVDLPGTYSLISRSPDEQVAMEVLRGLRQDTPPPDVVVAVVDASNLQRNLYLVSQLIELGRPLVVALNMMDVAERRGLHVSPAQLAAELGVTVVPVVGHKRVGVNDLKAALLKATVAAAPDWRLPDAMKEELLLIGGELALLDDRARDAARQVQATTLELGSAVRATTATPTATTATVATASAAVPVMVAAGAVGGSGPMANPPPLSPRPSLSRYQTLAERMLIGDPAADLGEWTARPSVAALLQDAGGRLASLGIDPMQADIEAHYRWIERVVARAVASVEELAAMGSVAPEGVLPGAAPAASAGPVGQPALKTAPAAPGERHPLPLAIPSPASNEKSLGALPGGGKSAGAGKATRRPNWSERLDAVFIHKFWGLLIFALIMGTLFVSIFWLAKPIMDGIKAGIDALGVLVTHQLSEGPIKDLLKDGVFTGVGSVVVFVPQIALLFFFLSVLEDSGYLARAAFLMDRLLAKVGLHGKSFIPLLSSFACAIPGIMATRTIENRKDRLATILVAPFMSCSARLPVYTLLIGTFFAAWGAAAEAGIMLACYALGILAAAGTAWVFKRSLLKGPVSAFILELPTYKMPQASQVARQVWTNTRQFLTKAGTTIFCLCVVLWAVSYYPRLPQKRVDELTAQARQEVATATPRNPAEEKGVKKAEDEAGELSDEEKEQADKRIKGEQQAYSMAGRIGHAMEPAIRPLGYDWKMGVGLVGAFAAREVFVSTMGIIYSVGDTEKGTIDLVKAMQIDEYATGPRSGQKVWTPLVAVSLLAWFVLAMQCMSTVAIVRRETGGWGWPLFLILYMNGLAYAVALGVYQVGRLFGIA